MLMCEYARRRKGWKQDDLQKAAHIALPFICMLEHGRCTPTPSQAHRLAAALEIPVEMLLLPVPDLATPSILVQVPADTHQASVPVSDPELVEAR